MTTTIVNPPALHPPTGYGYSHLARVPAGAELVLVAGQYASDAEGHVVSDDFAAQVKQSFANVRTALEAVELDLSDVVQIRTYITNHEESKLYALVGEIQAIWGDLPPAQTLLGVAALALPEMQFEVDAIAVRRPAA